MPFYFKVKDIICFSIISFRSHTEMNKETLYLNVDEHTSTKGISACITPTSRNKVERARPPVHDRKGNVGKVTKLHLVEIFKMQVMLPTGHVALRGI